MNRIARQLQWIRPVTDNLARQIRPHVSLILATVAIVVASLSLALAARAYDNGDQIQIGNTAGSLSTLIEIGDQRILVGAGPTRSHSADFVGRSTRPWDREIDLLIVPGWDDFHAVGTLGLLERRGVSGVAVIGIPGEAPVWTLLEREAQRNDVPVRFLDSSHQLSIAGESKLLISELANGEPGAWIRLEHDGVRIDLVDSDGIQTASPPPAAFDWNNDHVIVNMRAQNAPARLHPALLIQPRPFWQGDFEESAARYVAGIDRNQRVRLTFGSDGLRIPLEALDT